MLCQCVTSDPLRAAQMHYSRLSCATDAKKENTLEGRRSPAAHVVPVPQRATSTPTAQAVSRGLKKCLCTDGTSALQALRRVLSAEELDRLEMLTLQRTLDRMPDLVYCPRCSVATIEDDSHFAQCTKCDPHRNFTSFRCSKMHSSVRCQWDCQ